MIINHKNHLQNKIVQIKQCQSSQLSKPTDARAETVKSFGHTIFKNTSRERGVPIDQQKEFVDVVNLQYSGAVELQGEHGNVEFGTQFVSDIVRALTASCEKKALSSMGPTITASSSSTTTSEFIG
jgi:hypothetical protein